MLTDYCGATSRLPIERAPSSSQWVYQPKIDGIFVRLATDAAGIVYSALSRAGSPVAGLVGDRVGIPDAVLCGELEAHTEAGERAAATRGYRQVHLFDLARLARPLIAAPYRDRRAALVAAHDAASATAPDTADATGRHHDRAGRFARLAPRDIRRYVVVPQVASRRRKALWESFVEAAGGEGIVAVNLDAPLGARAAKRKIKASDTLDAIVVQADAKAAVVAWAGGVFVVGKGGLTVGATVEIRHDGYYEATGQPRFARVVRLRRDKMTLDQAARRMQ